MYIYCTCNCCRKVTHNCEITYTLVFESDTKILVYKVSKFSLYEQFAFWTSRIIIWSAITIMVAVNRAMWRKPVTNS